MVNYKLQSYATGFILRLILCMAILGGLYLLVFDHNLRSHNKPLTSTQRVANLRSALDQTYITANQIASFNNDTANGTFDLGNLVSQFNGSLANLQTDIKSSPSVISQGVMANIRAVVAQSQTTQSSYSNANNVLGLIISYDPASDLSPSLPANNSELQTRVQAAINGMTEAASSSASLSSSNDLSVQTNDGNLIVSSQTKTDILSEVNCFDGLLKNLQENDTSSSETTIGTCSKQYLGVRSSAMSDIISESYTGSYIQYLKSNVPKTLSSLDKIVNGANSSFKYHSGT